MFQISVRKSAVLRVFALLRLPSAHMMNCCSTLGSSLIMFQLYDCTNFAQLIERGEIVSPICAPKITRGRCLTLFSCVNATLSLREGV